MASRHRTLYVGVTSDLERRVFEHKHGLIEGFSRRYNCHRLVYFDATDDPHAAIAREKQLKSWARWKKTALIESRNPAWKDLSVGRIMQE